MATVEATDPGASPAGHRRTCAAGGSAGHSQGQNCAHGERVVTRLPGEADSHTPRRDVLFSVALIAKKEGIRLPFIGVALTSYKAWAMVWLAKDRLKAGCSR